MRLFPLTLNTVRKISDGSKYIRNAEGFAIIFSPSTSSQRMGYRQPHVQTLVAVEPVIAVIAGAAVVVAVDAALAAAVVMRRRGRSSSRSCHCFTRNRAWVAFSAAWEAWMAYVHAGKTYFKAGRAHVRWKAFNHAKSK